MHEKFWNWVKNEQTAEDELYFEGPIASETWFGDEVTPRLFQDELTKHPGNLTVWLNSPGGDVFAASQIYTMLRSHKGTVTVKIDGIAASAASVVAMAGDKTLISPTGYLMIHNPSMLAVGNKADMEKAIEMLDEIKEGILNAYTEKSTLSHDRIAKMMDEETWLSAKKAEKYGFVDGILFSAKETAVSSVTEQPKEPEQQKSTDHSSDTPEFVFSPATIAASLCAKLQTGTPIAQLEKRLALIKNWR